ncbi:ArnT family glycosyltransferase [Eubacterium barkeri]|uniref:4-amino-4-deoxy-L-arabinose transferase n=1 Tax=Eubacterium barkeri TaxID=1528 RepID=A0A1H3K4S4_EUBBA|nr:hypothetical protein [Eubacterium barkeri]SDY46608.1 4-amino-4-deoxy-L-arabinose transferase [Eubacterium barkeri]
MTQITRFCKNYYLEILFILFIFTIYMCWAILIPFNQAPDEQMRYLIPKFIFNHGTLPLGDHPEIVNRTWGQSYAYQPILAYQIAAVAMKIGAFFGMPENSLYLSARVCNVLFGTGTAILALAIGRRAFPGKYQFLFPVLLCLWPEVIFINAYVNNDALAFFAATLIFYAWILGHQREWDLRSCIVLALGLSLCFLSYYNAYGFIFCSAFLYAAEYYLNRKKWPLKRFLGYGLMIIGICAVLAGWWFVRSAILYDGDFLGLAASNALAEKLAQPDFKPSAHMTPQNQGYSLLQMLIGPITLYGHGSRGWLFNSVISIIGVFGNASIAMSMASYLLMGGMVLGGLICAFFCWWCTKRKGMGSYDWIWGMTLFLAILMPVSIGIYYSYTSDYQPQGRYIITLLIPLLYLITWGYIWFQEWINEKLMLLRMHWQLPVQEGLMGMVSCVSFVALCGTLFNYYHG